MAMKSLLVPVDFSDASNLVIEKVGQLAQELSARVVLLHVDEPKVAYAAFGNAGSVLVFAWPMETSRRICKLETRLASNANPLKARGVKVEFVALVGLVVHEILEQAGKYHADYIVMGSHGHFAAHHLFSGNVFAKILKHPLSCPIIVVPVTRESPGDPRPLPSQKYVEPSSKTSESKHTISRVASRIRSSFSRV